MSLGTGPAASMMREATAAAHPFAADAGSDDEVVAHDLVGERAEGDPFGHVVEGCAGGGHELVHEVSLGAGDDEGDVGMGVGQAFEKAGKVVAEVDDGLEFVEDDGRGPFLGEVGNEAVHVGDDGVRVGRRQP